MSGWVDLGGSGKGRHTRSVLPFQLSTAHLHLSPASSQDTAHPYGWANGPPRSTDPLSTCTLGDGSALHPAVLSAPWGSRAAHSASPGHPLSPLAAQGGLQRLPFKTDVLGTGKLFSVVSEAVFPLQFVCLHWREGCSPWRCHGQQLCVGLWRPAPAPHHWVILIPPLPTQCLDPLCSEISLDSHLGRRVRSIPCGRGVVEGTGQSLGALLLPKTFSASASCLLHTLMRQSQK